MFKSHTLSTMLRLFIMILVFSVLGENAHSQADSERRGDAGILQTQRYNGIGSDYKEKAPDAGASRESARPEQVTLHSIESFAQLKEAVCGKDKFLLYEPILEKFIDDLRTSQRASHMPPWLQNSNIRQLSRYFRETEKCIGPEEPEASTVGGLGKKRAAAAIKSRLYTLAKIVELHKSQKEYEYIMKTKESLIRSQIPGIQWPDFDVFRPCEHFRLDVEKLINFDMDKLDIKSFSGTKLMDVDIALNQFDRKKSELWDILDSLNRSQCYPIIQKNYRYFTWTPKWDEMMALKELISGELGRICRQ